MQLKKQVNNKIRKILKNSKWIQIPNFNPLCGVGEGGFSLLDCLVMPSVARHLPILGRGKRPLPN